LVGGCRHLAAVVVVSIVDLWSIHNGRVTVSVLCRHDGLVRNIHDRRVRDGRVYSGSVEYTRRSCPYYVGTTVVYSSLVVSVTSALFIAG